MTARMCATRDVAAYVAGVSPKTISVWVSRGHISRPVAGLYDLAEIVAWVERRDEHHAKICASRYDSPVVLRWKDS